MSISQIKSIIQISGVQFEIRRRRFGIFGWMARRLDNNELFGPSSWENLEKSLKLHVRVHELLEAIPSVRRREKPVEAQRRRASEKQNAKIRRQQEAFWKVL